ncbi:dTMP kinase [Candidatus Microgenomates bacterium]|nr:dTMP kinase [Candidatus Microgenomates bacterium]
MPIGLEGKYIVLEGRDKSGKSTQAQMLAGRLDEAGYETTAVREPGSTPMAEAIRTLLKDKQLERTARTNLWLFSTARVDLIEKIIRPAVAAGKIVVSDRNWVSTHAYQGYGEGYDLEDIWRVTELATGMLMRPDLLFFVDTPNEEIAKRFEADGVELDYFEAQGPEFFDRVRDGYLATVQSLGAVAINGLGSKKEVHERIWAPTQSYLEGLSSD